MPTPVPVQNFDSTPVLDAIRTATAGRPTPPPAGPAEGRTRWRAARGRSRPTGRRGRAAGGSRAEPRSAGYTAGERVGVLLPRVRLRLRLPALAELERDVEAEGRRRSAWGSGSRSPLRSCQRRCPAAGPHGPSRQRRPAWAPAGVAGAGLAGLVLQGSWTQQRASARRRRLCERLRRLDGVLLRLPRSSRFYWLETQFATALRHRGTSPSTGLDAGSRSSGRSSAGDRRSRLGRPLPDLSVWPRPSATPLDWTGGPALLWVLGAALLYWLGGRGRRPARAADRWRTAAFVAGLLAIVVALDSPLDELADELFWAHMAQHLLLDRRGSRRCSPWPAPGPGCGAACRSACAGHVTRGAGSTSGRPPLNRGRGDRSAAARRSPG